MLQRLSIRNFLLIEDLTIDLEGGFTVLTGETGSGKSMFVDALGLAMGNRADAGVVRNPDKRCIIELEALPPESDQWFELNDIPVEPTLFLRRQIEVGGRSRAFVNDTPVRLEQLRELASRLVYVHSQHQTRLLSSNDAFIGLIDKSAGLLDLKKEYVTLYDKWRNAVRELEELTSVKDDPSLDADYLRFQLDELQAADIRGQELEQLEQELNAAENAEDLIALNLRLEETLDGEQGLLGILNELYQAARKLGAVDEITAAFAGRLQSSYLELKDLAADAGAHAQNLETDPERAEHLRSRIDLLNRLVQKHRVINESELLGIMERISSKVNELEDIEHRAQAYQAEIEQTRSQLMDCATRLSKSREQAVPALEKLIMERLQQLGMEGARIRIVLNTKEPGPSGSDGVEPRFSADADRPLAPLAKVASGGELSRLMLALIGPISTSLGVETIILDEIDSGVSGEVADRVGGIMKRMSESTQLLTITHLPQVARHADHHLYVSKELDAGGTASHMRWLNMDERIKALAEMLSGNTTSKAALDNAKELLAGN